jgi:SAM-dependent methyltransferase
VLLAYLGTTSSTFAQDRAPSPETQALGKSWDAAYVNPEFNLKPNAFLVDAAKRLKPETALDVGMGQGRNAIYLAQQGWTVTGFDPSQVGVSKAREAARAAGVPLTARVERSQEFEWGTDRWDLIVATYFPALRQSAQTIVNSLRPGGVLVVEAFQKDAALDREPEPGPGVTFDVNELLALFPTLRVLRYEDLRAQADWGLYETRLVRLLAQKRP